MSLSAVSLAPSFSVDVDGCGSRADDAAVATKVLCDNKRTQTGWIVGFSLQLTAVDATDQIPLTLRLVLAENVRKRV